MKIQIPIFPNPHSRIRCQGWHNGNACSMISWHLNISGTSEEKVSIRTEEGRMEAMNHLVNWGNKNRPCLPLFFVRAQTMKVRARHAGISHCPRLFFVAFNGCSHSPWSSQTERGVSFKITREFTGNRQPEGISPSSSCCFGNYIWKKHPFDFKPNPPRHECI